MAGTAIRAIGERRSCNLIFRSSISRHRPIFHAEIAIAALDAGKHVLCEKPLAMTVAEAEAIQAAARNSRGRFAVAFNYRFVPAIQLARQIIAEGRLGRIYHFRARYLQDWLASPDAPMSWRLDKQRAGSGVLGDLGAHIIDLAHFLVGPMTEIVGHTAISSRSGSGLTAKPVR